MNKQRAIRIIFVGVHNKPDMEPLDSRTRTGKLVDRVIQRVSEVPNENHLFLKSNLFNIDYFPRERTAAHDFGWIDNWKDRVNWTDDDVVVTLGQIVNEVFRKAKVRCVKTGHPSAVWSHDNQEKYIERVFFKIADECAHQCSKTTERATEYLISQGYDPEKLVADGIEIINSLIAKIKAERQ